MEQHKGVRRGLRPFVAVTSPGILATCVLLTFAPVPAYAAGGLSSIVISRALPGMVEAPPGRLNGPITPSELDSLSETSGPVKVLSQAISDGNVSAYLRSWSDDPPNGSFVQVTALQFPSVSEASSALAGADHAASGSNGAHFQVTEIPHAFGTTILENSQAGLVSEDTVLFAKGTALFDVGVGQATNATNTGVAQLGVGDAIEIARRQAALAPGESIGPTNPGAGQSTNLAYQLGQVVGVLLLILLIVGLVGVLVRRRGMQRTATAPMPVGWPSPAFPVQTQTSERTFSAVATFSGSSTARNGAAVLERPPVIPGHVFYCGWCGKSVQVSATSPHQCERRGGASTYCMHCGSSIEEHVVVCASCGNRRLQ